MANPATHVVEWSVVDRTLRVRPVDDFLRANVQQFFEGTPRDYAPIGFFDSPEAATEFLQRRIARAAGLN